MKKKIITLIITIILLSYIFTKVNVNEVYNAFLKVNPVFLLIFILGVSFSFIIKSLQWNQLIKVFKDINFLKLYPLLVLSNISAKLTPGNVGEFYRGELLSKNFGIPRSKSYSTVVIDKMISLLASFIIIFFSLVAIRELFVNEVINSILFVFSLFSLVVLSFFLFVFSKKVQKLLIKITPKRYKKYIHSKINNVRTAVRLIKENKIQIIKSLIISITFWQFVAINYWVLLIGLGHYTNLIYITTSTLITVLITMIPITISGIGTREISLIFFFKQIGIPIETTVTFSLLNYSLNVITLLILNLLIRKKEIKLK